MSWKGLRGISYLMLEKTKIKIKKWKGIARAERASGFGDDDVEAASYGIYIYIMLPLHFTPCRALRTLTPRFHHTIQEQDYKLSTSE